MAQPALLRCLLLLALVWRSSAQASTQLANAYQTDLIAWYDAADVIPGATSPSWTSQTGAYVVNFGGSNSSLAVDQADPTGAAGNNQCPVTYLSGAFTPGSPAGTGSTMMFAPTYSSLGKTAFTFCSVTRYTKSQSTGRILQDVDGANCACRVPRRAAP